MRDLVEFFFYLAIAQMWNLLAGYAGLVSIGQQAFVGFGAYALYVLVERRASIRSSRLRSPASRRLRSPFQPLRLRSVSAAATSRSERG